RWRVAHRDAPSGPGALPARSGARGGGGFRDRGVPGVLVLEEGAEGRNGDEEVVPGGRSGGLCRGRGPTSWGSSPAPAGPRATRSRFRAHQLSPGRVDVAKN